MTLSSYEQYEFRACPDCGIEYAAPKIFMEECRRNPSLHFYCPNGHRRHFSESLMDKLKRENDRLKQQQARLEDELKAAERANKKLKKRAAAGTCPCCHRSFANMATHMKLEHPEFVKETGANVVTINREKAK